jgi:hypothetical protein
MARLILLLLMAVALGGYWWQRNQNIQRQDAAAANAPPPTNALALGAAAGSDAIDIRINAPAELDRLSKTEVLALRQRAVMAYPQVLAGPYTPSEAVFGQIVGSANWWGIPGQFRRGPGPESIEGPSEESRFILNPYLLVAPEFRDWWPHLTDSEAANFPFVCYPQSLRWIPREARVEASYAASCIAQRQSQEFDLIAYNARDLGLGFIYVAYEESSNVSKPQAPTQAYENPQFIHKGGSCGYPGGCNNMSPQTPPIDGIQIQALPATVVVKLWRSRPASVGANPDLKYVLEFR